MTFLRFNLLRGSLILANYKSVKFADVHLVVLEEIR